MKGDVADLGMGHNKGPEATPVFSVDSQTPFGCGSQTQSKQRKREKRGALQLEISISHVDSFALRIYALFPYIIYTYTAAIASR